MRYPNLRYGNPNEFAFYAVGIPDKDMAKRLRRSERSVKDWLSGKRKMPWWMPELLRLQRMEAAEKTRKYDGLKIFGPDQQRKAKIMKPIGKAKNVYTPIYQQLALPLKHFPFQEYLSLYSTPHNYN